MNKLEIKDLMSLEKYAKQRNTFRGKVLQHKKNRQVCLNDNATLYFEDRLTMQYQIQEMLRIEKIFEEQGIREELDAYNPLIPDGNNLKATFMIEYADVEERKQALAKLVGVEDKIWIRFDEQEKVFAIADEDMERDTEDKTSAVHFMRFEFSPQMVETAKQGATMYMGVAHNHMDIEGIPVAAPVREALVADFS